MLGGLPSQKVGNARGIFEFNSKRRPIWALYFTTLKWTWRCVFFIISPRTALKETLTAKNIGSFVLNTRRENKFRALLHSIALHLEACFRDQRSVCLIQRDVVDWFIESSSLFGYYLICGFSSYLVIYLFIYVFLPLLFYWKTVYLPTIEPETLHPEKVPFPH